MTQKSPWEISISETTGDGHEHVLASNPQWPPPQRTFAMRTSMPLPSPLQTLERGDTAICLFQEGSAVTLPWDQGHPSPNPAHTQYPTLCSRPQHSWRCGRATYALGTSASTALNQKPWPLHAGPMPIRLSAGVLRPEGNGWHIERTERKADSQEHSRVKLSFRTEENIKSFPYKQKLKEFSLTRCLREFEGIRA